MTHTVDTLTISELEEVLPYILDDWSLDWLKTQEATMTEKYINQMLGTYIGARAVLWVKIKQLKRSIFQ